MPDPPIRIRRASPADFAALGALGAQLVQGHYAFDQRRFMAPGEQLEEGYAAFLGTQSRRRDSAVFVAELDGQIVGYAYTAIEPRSWKELRDEAGFIHDLIVDERARGRGVAGRLVDAVIAWLHERGMPRVLLQTAEQNDAAQRLFARLGFRRTMIEMTREIE